ncbi:MAG: DUF4278 domain-containing protein [Calothrix sp. MO_167.B42]|nr:DUF4278 domain-containing protein [Calothrix sp. MO_167.B42]
MKLCYRGVTYQAKTTPIKTVKSGITAKFLGRTYMINRADSRVVSQPNSYQYRGITYQIGNKNITSSDKYCLINQNFHSVVK